MHIGQGTCQTSSRHGSDAIQTQTHPPSGTIQQRLTMHANDTQGNHSTHQPSMLTTGTDARLHRSHALGGVGYQVNTP